MGLFKSEFVFEGQVCRRERAKDAKGINSVEIGQSYGTPAMAFYFSTKKEAQELFDRVPDVGVNVRIRGEILPKAKIGKGDRVVTQASFSVVAVDLLGAAGGPAGEAGPIEARRRAA